MLDATDVLVHPTLIDALPTALMEAMAARVPTVATGVGGVPELIEHGNNGLLIPAPPTPDALAEALASLLDDPPGARRWARGPGSGSSENTTRRGGSTALSRCIRRQSTLAATPKG